jgi:hypothetical protein
LTALADAPDLGSSIQDLMTATLWQAEATLIWPCKHSARSRRYAVTCLAVAARGNRAQPAVGWTAVIAN